MEELMVDNGGGVQIVLYVRSCARRGLLLKGGRRGTGGGDARDGKQFPREERASIDDGRLSGENHGKD